MVPRLMTLTDFYTRRAGLSASAELLVSNVAPPPVHVAEDVSSAA